MLFNSLEFLIFFTLICFLYYLLPQRFRWMLLLIASYYFYMSVKVEYGILLLLSTIIGYAASLQIDAKKSKSARKAWLWISLLGNFGMLFAFKYLNFVSDNLASLFGLIGIQFSPLAVSILLPVGISFYTFQAVSYSLDVYFRRIKAERHFGMYSVYHAFFPQLVAGPIERASNLLPQFSRHVALSYNNISLGFGLMLWGFFKKVVIADRLSLLVTQVFSNPQEFSGPSLLLATFFFAIQIYCDFSGYSDIARGSARMLGFELMQNFRRPYFAHSFSDFWNRWHISLSSWFRDYLYIPLGGNRLKVPHWSLLIFLVFFTSGVWHGANWTFIAWGVLHGLYLILARLIPLALSFMKKLSGSSRLSQKAHADEPSSLFGGVFLRIAVFAAVCFAWIFFRANSLSDALYIAGNLFSHTGAFFSDLSSLGLTRPEFILALITISLLFVLELIWELDRRGEFSSRLLGILRSPIKAAILYSFMIILILLLGTFGNNEFIYFRF